MNILRRTQQSCNSVRLSSRLDVPQNRAALGALVRGDNQPLAVRVSACHQHAPVPEGGSNWLIRKLGLMQSYLKILKIQK